MAAEFLDAANKKDSVLAGKLIKRIRQAIDGFVCLPVHIIAAVNGLAYGGVLQNSLHPVNAYKALQPLWKKNHSNFLIDGTQNYDDVGFSFAKIILYDKQTKRQMTDRKPNT